VDFTKQEAASPRARVPGRLTSNSSGEILNHRTVTRGSRERKRKVCSCVCVCQCKHCEREREREGEREGELILVFINGKSGPGGSWAAIY
jgi:hypothetical protein